MKDLGEIFKNPYLLEIHIGILSKWNDLYEIYIKIV